MGLLDGALGDMAGSLLGGQGGNAEQMLGGLLSQFGGAGSQKGLLVAAMQLVQQQGGLEALVQKFQAGGLGDVVQSWVGTGANAPVSGAQLEQVLGADALTSASSQAGLAPANVKDGLASMLPDIVNQLTPGGQLPANSGALITAVLGRIRG
jgi:uncharacterized protein YidB (DUF937 family)